MEGKTGKYVDRKIVLFVLWIFVMLNYLYCDVLTLLDPNYLKGIVEGTAAVKMNSAALLGAAVLMEIPIAMVLLSRLLPHGWNRALNIIAGSIMTLVQIGSLLVDVPTAYYIFFSIIEITCTAAIAIIAIRWKKPDVPDYPIFSI